MVVIDVRRLSSVTDFFVIATAATHRQMAAIVEHIDEVLRQAGRRVGHVEGLQPAERSAPEGFVPFAPSGDFAPFGDFAPSGDFAWVLIDAGDLVIHLFNPPARTFYQLEHLWGDAPRLSLDPKQLLSA